MSYCDAILPPHPYSPVTGLTCCKMQCLTVMPSSLPILTADTDPVGGVSGQMGDNNTAVGGQEVLSSFSLFLVILVLSSSISHVTSDQSIFLCQCDQPVQDCMVGVSLPYRDSERRLRGGSCFHTRIDWEGA